MRVLLVSHHFPPENIGGVERYTQDLAAELVASGDSVTITARRSERGRTDAQLMRERLPDGSSLYRVVAGSFSFENFLEDSQRMEQLFALALLESSAEIVHVNHLMGFSPRSIEIAHRLGAAVVVSLHDFYFVCPRVHLQKPSGDLCGGPDDGYECIKTCFISKGEQARLRWSLRSLYFRKALAMAERIVCYSEYVAEYFRNVFDGGPPIHVIPNGVPLGSVSCGQTGLNDARHETLHLAYCGTVARHKGPHVILEALRVAKLPSVKLLIIGDFPEAGYAKQLRETAATIPGLTLQLYGRYERRELSLLLGQMDFVVVPSLVAEAGPIVPREALAQGVPVIAARLGALTELIREGENGFTFDSGRPAELGALLRRIAADETLRLRLRAGARMSTVITVAEHARRVRAVYETAVRDFTEHPQQRAEAGEFNSLHRALLDLGCGPSRRAGVSQSLPVH